MVGLGLLGKYVMGGGGALASVVSAFLGLSKGSRVKKVTFDVQSFPKVSVTVPSLPSLVEVDEVKVQDRWEELKRKSNEEYEKSYKSELATSLRFILSADSTWGWADILRVNKRPVSESFIKGLMDSCEKIYKLQKSSLTDEQKAKHREYARLNCQWPKTSGRKFKENGLNFVEKTRDIYYNTFANKDSRFWANVEDYNKLKQRGNKSDVEKYRFYCDSFPKFQTTEDGYTVEELDYMEFCWSQRLRGK